MDYMEAGIFTSRCRLLLCSLIYDCLVNKKTPHSSYDWRKSSCEFNEMDLNYIVLCCCYIIISYKCLWTGLAAEELATLVFYVFAGFKVKPMTHNPSFIVDDRKDEQHFEFIVLQTAYEWKVDSIMPTSFCLTGLLFESTIRGEYFHTWRGSILP